ncbi:hypothetical protein D3C86_1763230 [compost metagenome]
MSSAASSGKPVFSCTSAKLTPGCSERTRTARSGPPKSITHRSVTTWRMSIRSRREPSSQRSGLKPTPETMSTSPATNTRGPWLGTKNELMWLMLLPGRPRTPSMAIFGWR